MVVRHHRTSAVCSFLATKLEGCPVRIMSGHGDLIQTRIIVAVKCIIPLQKKRRFGKCFRFLPFFNECSKAFGIFTNAPGVWGCKA
jgi:hypothetical protein